MTQEQKILLKNKLNGLSEATLDKVVIETSKLIDHGFKPIDAFPIGITIPKENATIRLISKKEEHSILTNFLDNHPNRPIHSNRRVFTLGIFMDDYVQTEIDLG